MLHILIQKLYSIQAVNWCPLGLFLIFIKHFKYSEYVDYDYNGFIRAGNKSNSHLSF